VPDTSASFVSAARMPIAADPGGLTGSRDLGSPQPDGPAARTLNTKALAAGIVSSVAAAALGAAAPAAANVTVYWGPSRSACCSARHFGPGHTTGRSQSVWLPNWYLQRHNAGIWECAQYRFSTGGYTSWVCGSAYHSAFLTELNSGGGVAISPLCWTNSNNVGGVSHKMTCREWW
jgi:hypothetical protein